MNPNSIKQCPECGKEFDRQANRQRYCSKTCRIKTNNKSSYSKHRNKRLSEMRAYHARHREEQNLKNRAWFAKNREAQNAKRKKYHIEHREEQLQKMRENRLENIEDRRLKEREYHHSHKTERNQRRARRWGIYRAFKPNHLDQIALASRVRKRTNAPWLSLLASAYRRAAKKNVSYTLTPAWAEERWTGVCELTGIPFNMGMPGKPGPRLYSPSIDRIVPSLGYVEENCRFILWAINSFKGEGTDDDMLKIATCLVENLTKTSS